MRCHSCNKRIWPWQKWGGVGSIGFRKRDAHAAWHVKCSLRDHIERHRTNGCTSVCRLLGCPSDS